MNHSSHNSSHLNLIQEMDFSTTHDKKEKCQLLNQKMKFGMNHGGDHSKRNSSDAKKEISNNPKDTHRDSCCNMNDHLSSNPKLPKKERGKRMMKQNVHKHLHQNMNHVGGDDEGVSIATLSDLSMNLLQKHSPQHSTLHKIGKQNKRMKTLSSNLHSTTCTSNHSKNSQARKTSSHSLLVASNNTIHSTTASTTTTETIGSATISSIGTSRTSSPNVYYRGHISHSKKR